MSIINTIYYSFTDIYQYRFNNVRNSGNLYRRRLAQRGKEQAVTYDEDK